MDDIAENEMWFYYGVAVGLAISSLVVIIGLGVFIWWALS